MSGMMDEMRAYFQVWNAAKEDIMLTATRCWVKITNAVCKTFLDLAELHKCPQLLKHVNQDKLVRHDLQIFTRYSIPQHATVPRGHG